MIILAIETSCDDTSAAIIKTQSEKRKAKNKNPGIKILANLVSSQINIHKKWGGVVPNLASRAHAKNLPIVFEKALKEAKLKIENIDAIAVTIGPGLSPSLLIGVHFARALAFKHNKPIIPINHVEGHIYSNFLQNLSNFQFPIFNFQTKSKTPIHQLGNNFQTKKLQTIKFPIMNLIVSGGHTSLYLMKNFGKYELIGKTRDDAAGEAFDKAAKMMGLGYPGGPAISRLAEKWNFQFPIFNFQIKSKILNSKFHPPAGGLNSIKFPRPMINSKDFDFSFSGLKTAVFYKLKELSEKQKINKDIKIAIAHEFQQAVIDVLISKTISSAQKYNAKVIAISGGVSANNELRRQMEIGARENNLEILLPPKNMTTDNALMIAVAGYFNLDKKTTWDKIDADPNLKL